MTADVFIHPVISDDSIAVSIIETRTNRKAVHDENNFVRLIACAHVPIQTIVNNARKELVKSDE